MSGQENGRRNPTAVIWMPIGRDAALAASALSRAGTPARCCETLTELSDAVLEADSGVLLIVEEALTPVSIEQIQGALARQPAWSDLPIILLTGGGNSTELSMARLRRMQALGKSILMERPLRSVTLVAAVQAAFRSRARQYDIRDYIAELEDAQARLANANADLKQFAFVASHDLREPLRMVNIFTQLLLQRHIDQSNSDAQELAGFVRTGVNRMEALLSDLLSYSRVIHDESTRPNNRFDISLAISDAMTSLVVEIGKSSAEVIIGPMPIVSGNRTQLSLVFQNLLSNSIKYAKPGGTPHIEITALPRGSEHLIQFTDNGIGFEQKYSERIFDLFQRLNDSNVDGTGLGLAISRRIVEQHGGRLWAESNPSLGSTFYLALPVSADTSLSLP
jgi:signal transduction histidine kinase